METARMERALEARNNGMQPRQADDGQRSEQEQEVWLAVWQPWPPEPLRVFGSR